MSNKVENTTKRKSPLDWLLANKNPIQVQEEKSQKELEESLQLPLELNTPHGKNVVELYHKMGIKTFVPSKGDTMFIGVKLPEGWVKKATDHAMWSNLLDSKGRKRASIFYKGSPYDRKSHIDINPRYRISVDRVGFQNGDYSQNERHEYHSYKTPIRGIVIDFDKTILFSTEEIPCEVTYKANRNGGYTESYIEQSRRIERELTEKCLAFMEQNYPKYEDVTAYWD